jgi:hypothetical protein
MRVAVRLDFPGRLHMVSQSEFTVMVKKYLKLDDEGSNFADNWVDDSTLHAPAACLIEGHARGALVREEIAAAGGVEGMLNRRNYCKYRSKWVDDESELAPAASVLQSKVTAALVRQEVAELGIGGMLDKRLGDGLHLSLTLSRATSVIQSRAKALLVRQEVEELGIEGLLQRREYRENWVDDRTLHEPAASVLQSKVRALSSQMRCA